MLATVKGETDSNTIIVGDFNTPLKQKINRETQTLNDTLDQIDLIDSYRTFHPKAAEYTFYQVHTEHSPGQKKYQTNNLTLYLKQLGKE